MHSVQPLEATATNRPLSIWKGVLIILVLGVIQASLYYAGILSKDWLNRTGIVLNIVTGMLFAPTVLDMDGWFGRFVPWLEYSAGRIYQKISAPLPGLGMLFDNFAGKKESKLKFVLFCLIFLIVVGFCFLKSSVATALALLITLYLVVIIDVMRDNAKGQKVETRSLILLFLFFPYLFVIILFLTPPIFIIWKVLQFLSSITHGLHGSLVEKVRLRQALITWGVLVFIMGNVFQLLATF